MRTTSEKLAQCFGKSQDIKFVIIELRKKGIIVHIRNAVNNYVWLIPFHHLSIFKSDLLSIQRHNKQQQHKATTIYIHSA